LRSVNKIILIFVFFVGSLFVGVWSFIQSEYFSDIIVSNIITKVSSKYNLNIGFKKISISLIPPETILGDVVIESLDKENFFRLDAKRLGAQFGMRDFFVSNPSIQKILIHDGLYQDSLNSKEKISFDDIDQRKNMLRKTKRRLDALVGGLPFVVKEVEILNFKVEKNDFDLLIKDMSFGIYENLYTMDIFFENLWLKKEGVKKLYFDSFKSKLEMSSSKLRFSKLSLKNKFDHVKGSGHLDYYSGEKLDIDLNFWGGLKKVFSLVDYSNSNISDAYIHTKISLKGELEDPQVSFATKVEDLNTEWGKAKLVFFEGEMDRDLIKITDANIEDGRATASLKNEIMIRKYRTKNIEVSKVKVDVKSLHTNQALYSLRSSMNTFKGLLNGEVDILFKQKEVKFEFGKKASLVNFMLLDEYGNKILKNDRVEFGKSEISIFILEDSVEVGFDVALRKDNLAINSVGLITEDGLNFQAVNSKFDFADFGPIYGVDIDGRGEVSFEITSDFDNLIINVDGELKNFSIFDYSLDSFQSRIIYDLNTNTLKIEDGISQGVDSLLKGDGYFNFKESSVDLDISVENEKLSRLPFVFEPVFGGIKEYIDGNESEIDANFRVSGKMTSDKINVVGDVKGRNVLYEGENLDNLDFKFSYGLAKLHLSDIKGKHDDATVRGNLYYDFTTNYLEYDAILENLRARSLNSFRKYNSVLESRLFGEFFGSGTESDFTSKSVLDIKSARVGSKVVGDSTVYVYGDRSKYSVRAKLFNDAMVGKLEIDTDKSIKKNNSSLDVTTKNIEVPVLLALLVGDKSLQKKFNGVLNFDLSSNFNPYNLTNLDAKLNLLELSIFRRNKSISKRKASAIIIEKGRVKNWSLDFSGSGGQISSIVQGKINEDLKMVNSFKIYPGMIESFVSGIEKITGKLTGEHTLINGNNTLIQNFSMSAQDIGLQASNLPTPIEALSFDVQLEGDDLILQGIKGKVGNGELEGSGKLKLLGEDPQVNLDLTVKNANLSFLKKSNVVVSGKMGIEGERRPYKLNGQFSIDYGEVSDSINEFTKNQINTEKYLEYLPSREDEEEPLFIFNVALDIVGPVKVRNTLTALEFDGRLKINGTAESPTFRGDLQVLKGVSKFLFKGHEFLLTEGKCSFADTTSGKNRSLRFAGSTIVGEYKINLIVQGPFDKVDIKLSSTPSLPQKEIVSLLTLGITSDISKGLAENDRASITSVSVGTMLVDQLRINEELSRSLGVKLSVLPEIEEDDAALLQARSGVSSSGTTRSKTATKIKVKKELSKKVDLSVSGVVGGSLDQKQQMNLDFKIDTHFSLEGIYEIKSTEDESSESVDSAGVDLKYKWSF
jgi:translocation and assembly module TamB